MIYTNEELKEFFKNLEANDKTKASYALRKLHPYSITKVLETLSEPFDREAVAERTAAKYKDTEGHKYSGKEAWEIIQMWEEKSEISRTTGKLLDDYIGAILTNSIKSVEIYNSEIAKLHDRQKRFDNFNVLYNEILMPHNFEFICRELTLCDGQKFCKGRFDAIFLKGDKICLFDWKSNEEISTQNDYGKHMLGPLYKYDVCDLNGYTLQLYIYKYILKNVYHIDNEIVPCLCRIGPDKFEIYNHNIEYSDKLVEQIFKYAKSKLIQK